MSPWAHAQAHNMFTSAQSHEPPTVPTALVLPRLEVAPPELADYAELCA